MTKYEPLAKYLRSQRISEVPMTFAEVEKVIGAPLPPSAFRHRPWWANDASGHAHAKAWLEAGYQTERVDMDARRLVFVEFGKTTPVAGSLTPGAPHDRHPMLGAMRALGRAAPGVDLTEPADPDWGNRT
jgi:hypothetical protein